MGFSAMDLRNNLPTIISLLAIVLALYAVFLASTPRVSSDSEYLSAQIETLQSQVSDLERNTAREAQLDKKNLTNYLESYDNCIFGQTTQVVTCLQLRDIGDQGNLQSCSDSFFVGMQNCGLGLKNSLVNYKALGLGRTG
jgi:hypothetical protein